jgi:hypothetical protein
MKDIEDLSLLDIMKKHCDYQNNPHSFLKATQGFLFKGIKYEFY